MLFAHQSVPSLTFYLPFTIHFDENQITDKLAHFDIVGIVNMKIVNVLIISTATKLNSIFRTAHLTLILLVFHFMCHIFSISFSSSDLFRLCDDILVANIWLVCKKTNVRTTLISSLAAFLIVCDNATRFSLLTVI